MRMILAEVHRGIKRNAIIFVSVILVTFISLTFVGAALLLQLQITQAKDVWYDKVEVAVYLCPDGKSSSINCSSGIGATDEDINNLKKIINKELSDEVQEIYVETKQQAFEQFEKKYPGGEVNGHIFTADDMQRSLRLKLKNPENYQIIKEVLTGRNGVEEVNDQRQIFEPIFKMLNSMTYVAISLATLMLIAAMLLIMTTIRLSAPSRRKEIEIMRLVGASNGYIRMPFILEGVVSTGIGAILSIVGLACFVQLFIHNWLADQIRWMTFINIGSFIIVGPVLLVVAVLIAIIASSFTVRKYLKI